MDTVRKTRRLLFDELVHKDPRLSRSDDEPGVTSCEAKSGYSLDLETELKMLGSSDR